MRLFLVFPILFLTAGCRLAHTLDDMHDQIVEMNAKLVGLEQLNQKLATTNEGIAGINTTLIPINDGIAQLNTKLAKTNEGIADLNTKLAKTNDALADLNTKLGKTNDGIGELNGKLKDTNAILVNVEKATSKLGKLAPAK